MSTRNQLLLSLLIVGGALAIVTIRPGSSGSEVMQQEASAEGGHDHAAMLAGGETMPVSMSPEDARRIGVTFAMVERRPLPLTVVAVGTAVLDETGLAVVSPKIEGWIERLYVDFTGAPIQEGAPLFDVYSPRLVTAQEELILAARLASTASESRSIQNAQALLESARRRLEYWDIPFDEIRAIEESGKVRRTLTLRSPASGIVMEKTVVEGDRIMPGMITFRIADLSTTWVEADVFEKDLDLVRVGQRAHVTFESFPGRSFAAQVTYVYPTVSVGARTGRVRLELPNTGEELRPGMYADVELSIAPGAPTLIVPRSAVLSTGTRVLVFVSGEGGALDAREVTVGRTSGREIEVLSGLSEGDRVVSSSAFLVDAESSLGALRTGGGKPSPAEGDGSMDPPGHSPGG